MTRSIIAYTGWADQVGDEMGEWFWGQVAKVVLVGALISVPPMAVGMATAGPEVNRLDSGVEAVSQTHGFLWTYAGKAFTAVATPIGEWIDNNNNEV